MSHDDPGNVHHCRFPLFFPNCRFSKVDSFDSFVSTATLSLALTGIVYVDTCSNEWELSGMLASRSRPTNHRMFRGRARSSKWFVRSCSRLVPCWHWPWSLATLRLPSAGLRRLVVPRLHVVHPHRAVLLQAVPLLVVTAAALPQAVPLLAATAAVLLLAVQLQAVQLPLAALASKASWSPVGSLCGLDPASAANV